MDLFEKQAQLQSLFQTSPVDAAYAQGTAAGRKLAGSYSDLDVALLLLNRVQANEFFDYQVYFVSTRRCSAISGRSSTRSSRPTPSSTASRSGTSSRPSSSSSGPVRTWFPRSRSRNRRRTTTSSTRSPATA